MNIEHVKPDEIEKRSFEIISKELEEKGIKLDEDKAHIIKRAIHTTADFEYADTLIFSDGAVAKIEAAIKSGAHIVTDTNMALTGINKRELSKYGGEAHCFMADDDVARLSKEKGITRASVSVKKAMELNQPVIYVVGNAPTALITLKEYYDKKEFIPSFIVGVPVGFVNVEAAKELIIDTDIPYIINRGRKGGSNLAAAIINAILYKLREKDNG